MHSILFLAENLSKKVFKSSKYPNKFYDKNRKFHLYSFSFVLFSFALMLRHRSAQVQKKQKIKACKRPLSHMPSLFSSIPAVAGFYLSRFRLPTCQLFSNKKGDFLTRPAPLMKAGLVAGRSNFSGNKLFALQKQREKI